MSFFAVDPNGVGADIPLRVPLTRKVNVKTGKPKAIKAKLVVPVGLAAGTYKLKTMISAVSPLVDTLMSNDVVTSDETFSVS